MEPYGHISMYFLLLFISCLTAELAHRLGAPPTDRPGGELMDAGANRMQAMVCQSRTPAASGASSTFLPSLVQEDANGHGLQLTGRQSPLPNPITGERHLPFFFEP